MLRHGGTIFSITLTLLRTSSPIRMASGGKISASFTGEGAILTGLILQPVLFHSTIRSLIRSDEGRSFGFTLAGPETQAAFGPPGCRAVLRLPLAVRQPSH